MCRSIAGKTALSPTRRSMMTSRVYCQLSVTTILLLAHAAHAEFGLQVTSLGKRNLPNVLFIVVDDLNCHVGSYGESLVHTPNIDRLAHRGVLFERAYAQYPVCNPSRCSFLSGRRPESIDILDNSEGIRTKHPEIVTLPQCFRNAAGSRPVLRRCFTSTNGIHHTRRTDRAVGVATIRWPGTFA